MLLAVIAVADPAEAAPTTDVQGWTALQLSGPIAGKLVMWLDLTLRASENTRGIYQIEPVIGVGVRVTRAVIVTVGHGRILNRSVEGTENHEDRYLQQVQAKLGSIAGGALAMRARVEERRLSGARDTGLRARGQLRWVRPSGQRGTSAVLWHESFVILNNTDWGPPAGWNQMRNFVGLRRTIAPHLDVEGGYLNQYTKQVRRADTIDHVASVTMALAF